MSNKKMIYRQILPDRLTANGWINKVTEFEVKVLAIVDGYAMVRRPHCVPFVVREKDLLPLPNLKGE